uniref:FERM domain-containing protein n=1 Tax=Glossina pallidipes TaxID=7398 RepID=A0A1A9ZZX4_GLOPL
MSLADMGTATRGGGVAVIDHSSGGGVGGSGTAGGGAGGGLPGAGRMTHSLSTPSGVDGTPSTPRHRGGKKLTVRIQMLDDTVTMFQVQEFRPVAFAVLVFLKQSSITYRKCFVALSILNPMAYGLEKDIKIDFVTSEPYFERATRQTAEIHAINEQ